MSTKTPIPGEGRKWTYPQAEFAKMYAPLEKVHPAVKLRALLKAKYLARRTDPARCFLHTAGAYDAMTAALLTDIGFEAVYACGRQLAVARNMYPDIGLYPSHQMVELVRELHRGIEGARDRSYYDTAGQLKNVPPIFADIEAGFGGPTQTFALTREIIKAGAAGVHLGDQDPSERASVLVPTRKWIEKLIAVKAAAQAAESPLVLIARTDAAGDDAIERALEAASLGVDVILPEFDDTSLDAPRRFAEEVHARYPDQILGFDMSPSLQWGRAKREGRLPTNRELGQLGFTLQFSTLLAFRTSGMALETWLTGFQRRGIDALADLQLVETASLDGEPRTRMHQKFAGTDRWLSIERGSRAAEPAAAV
jgi:isocitrate lyase